MSHAGSCDSFREDAAAPGLPKDKAVEPAPDAQDGLFRVPRVL